VAARDTADVPWEPLPSPAEDEPRPVRTSLDRLVRHLGGSSTSAMQQLFGHWPALVGEQVAAHSRPLRLRDGTLSLVVDQPIWATQVRLLEADLLVALAERLGDGVVTSLRVRVGALDDEAGSA
jgi:predicted nucleic acid-binding Zn ribbon protein